MVRPDSDLTINSFDYELDKKFIAQEPIKPRHNSKLMVVENLEEDIKIAHKKFYEIISFFKKGDVLVLNNSKVTPSRIYGIKEETKGKVEALIIRKASTSLLANAANYSSEAALSYEDKKANSSSQEESGCSKEMSSLKERSCAKEMSSQKENCCKKRARAVYECLLKGKSLKHGTKIVFFPVRDVSCFDSEALNYKQEDAVHAEIIAKNGNIFILAFYDDISSKIDKIGHMPTPPYIKKQIKNPEDYQTSYASKPGSIAAPTAGFHFSKELLEKIKEKGVKIAYVTLHVSIATFLPVKSLKGHKTGKELFEITADSAEIINNRKGRLFVCGTTALKAIESSSRDNRLYPSKSYSELFISPGYKFNMDVDFLITNFHLPKSSLIMLVAAYIGNKLENKGICKNAKKEGIKRILAAYESAKENSYRFYSFGDAMLIY